MFTVLQCQVQRDACWQEHSWKQSDNFAYQYQRYGGFVYLKNVFKFRQGWIEGGGRGGGRHLLVLLYNLILFKSD